jgi:hypothetical protein
MDFTIYNKNTFKKIDWNRNTENFGFKKISDLYSEGITRVQVFGFFFTKSENFGLQPNAILNDCFLNLPTHLRDTVSKMLVSDECIDSIKRGECTLKFRDYMSKYNKMCYAVDFVNTVKNSGDTQPPIF